MNLRSLPILALLALQLTWSHSAHAEAPAPPATSTQTPLILDVSRAPGIDIERLRTAVANETHREVILPGDPKAIPPAERLVVTIADGRTRVRFESSPLMRDMPSEVGVDAQVRQVALLAGNLTRSEADDILSDLKKSRAPDKSDARPPPGEVKIADSDNEKEKDGELAYERLEGTLRYHVESSRSASLFAGLSLVGLSLVFVPIGAYARESMDERFSGTLVLGLGASFGIGGVTTLVTAITGDTPLQDLHRHLVAQHGTQPSAALVLGVEKEWREKGLRSTRTLRWIGGLTLAIGVAGAAVGTADVATASTSDPAGRMQLATGALMIGAGAFVSLFGLYALVTDSELSRDYDAYMRASKRPKASIGVAPLQGGAALSLSGTF